MPSEIGKTGKHNQRQVLCICEECKDRDDRSKRMDLIRKVAAEMGAQVSPEPTRTETQAQFARRMGAVARGRRKAMRGQVGHYGTRIAR